MIDDATRRRRLVARHHLGRTATDPLAAATDLIALHSSDPSTPHLSLRARVAGYRPDALDTDGPLWRLHAMRRTLWVAPAAHVGALDAAVGAGIARKERRRVLGWLAGVHGDPAAWLAALEDAILDAVGAAPGVSTRQLTASIPGLATRITVGSGKWKTQAPLASRLLMVMAMDLKLARTAPTGTWRSSQYGWRLPAEVERPEPEAARATLVRRYLERFGPATTIDIRWWTGMTAARVKRALEDVGAVEVELAGGRGWDAPDAPELPDPPESAPPQVALLPGLDPTPMGYKERSWFLGAHGTALFDRNGNVGPTLWLDGRIVGGWAVGADGKVRAKALEPLGDAAIAAVAAEAQALTAWLGGVCVTPRFRTPLEKTLAG